MKYNPSASMTADLLVIFERSLFNAKYTTDRPIGGCVSISSKTVSGISQKITYYTHNARKYESTGQARPFFDACRFSTCA